MKQLLIKIPVSQSIQEVMDYIQYNEKVEGIVAQQREADRRLKEIQAQRLIRAKGVA